jgi:hypothetical protein
MLTETGNNSQGTEHTTDATAAQCRLTSGEGSTETMDKAALPDGGENGEPPTLFSLSNGGLDGPASSFSNGGLDGTLAASARPRSKQTLHYHHCHQGRFQIPFENCGRWNLY